MVFTISSTFYPVCEKDENRQGLLAENSQKFSEENRDLLSPIRLGDGVRGQDVQRAPLWQKRDHFRRRGNWEVHVHHQGRASESLTDPTNGKETILAFHETGEHFGEMALLDGETAPANVTALVSTTILFIDSRGFATLLYNPQVNQALFKILSKRCRDA